MSLPWDEFALYRTFAVPPMFESDIPSHHALVRAFNAAPASAYLRYFTPSSEAPVLKFILRSL